jgi:signal transduction histidine kinase
VKRRSHQLVFGLALVLLVALAVWWTLFIVRSVRTERDTALELERMRVALESTGIETSGVPEPAANRIQERYDRRLAMIVGEGALMFVLLGVCILMLLRMVNQDRRQLEAMESFVSLVTHEMKTPLAGIKSLLQSAVSGSLPADRVDELMTMGLKETERLERMVENILIAGRLRVDQEVVEMAVVDLREFLERFVGHRRRLLSDRDRLVLDEDEGPALLQVLVDPDGLRVILENLVDNALKYGSEDGPVTIGMEPAGSRVLVHVVDRGVGLEPDELSRIFEPFHRTVSGESTIRQGTGLGLNIARSLARRMGGDVTAHSEGRGRGSRFTVTLTGRPT